MLLGLILVLVPADDGGEGSLHHALGRLVCPLGGEDKDLAGLLHVLLVHGGLLLAEHVGGERLGGGHAADGRGAQPHPSAQRHRTS